MAKNRRIVNVTVTILVVASLFNMIGLVNGPTMISPAQADVVQQSIFSQSLESRIANLKSQIGANIAWARQKYVFDNNGQGGVNITPLDSSNNPPAVLHMYLARTLRDTRSVMIDSQKAIDAAIAPVKSLAQKQSVSTQEADAFRNAYSQAIAKDTEICAILQNNLSTLFGNTTAQYGTSFLEAANAAVTNTLNSSWKTTLGETALQDTQSYLPFLNSDIQNCEANIQAMQNTLDGFNKQHENNPAPQSTAQPLSKTMNRCPIKNEDVQELFTSTGYRIPFLPGRAQPTAVGIFKTNVAKELEALGFDRTESYNQDPNNVLDLFVEWANDSQFSQNPEKSFKLKSAIYNINYLKYIMKNPSYMINMHYLSDEMKISNFNTMLFTVYLMLPPYEKSKSNPLKQDDFLTATFVRFAPQTVSDLAIPRFHLYINENFYRNYSNNLSNYILNYSSGMDSLRNSIDVYDLKIIDCPPTVTTTPPTFPDQMVPCGPVTREEMQVIFPNHTLTLQPPAKSQAEITNFERQLIEMFNVKDDVKPTDTQFYKNVMDWANNRLPPARHQLLRYTIEQLKILLGTYAPETFNFKSESEKFAEEIEISSTKYWGEFYGYTLANTTPQETDQLAGSLAYMNNRLSNPSKPNNKMGPDAQAALLTIIGKLQALKLAPGCPSTVTPPAPKPAVTPPAPKPTVTPPAPKPAVTPPAPKPTVTPPAPKPAVTPPAPKPAVSACPMMKREDIFTALSADVRTAPKAGSPESAYAAFDKNINTAFNRNNSKGGTSHYNLLKKAARGTPLTAAENKAVSQALLNTLENAAKKAPLPAAYEATRQSLKGCK